MCKNSWIADKVCTIESLVVMLCPVIPVKQSEIHTCLWPFL